LGDRRQAVAVLAISLIVKPGQNPTPRTAECAKKLWRKRHQGWVVEAIAPGPDLIADLEALTPRPRDPAP
jgi:hypothetical protein